MPWGTKTLLETLREDLPEDPGVAILAQEHELPEADPYEPETYRLELRRRQKARLMKEMLKRGGHEELARMVRVTRGEEE